MKKVFAITLTLIIVSLFSVSAFATESECNHPNMTTKITEQQADCYHTYHKTVSKYCPDCGYGELYVTEDSAYKHGEIEIIDNSKPATCVKNGWISYSYVCKECGQTVGGGIQPTTKIDHRVKIGEEYPDCYVVVERAVAGNCDSYGFEEKVLYCTECKCDVKVLDRKQLPMSEHYWTDWEIKDGMAERHCISCGKTEQQEYALADPITVTEIENENEFLGSIINMFKTLIEQLKAFYNITKCDGN